MGALGASAVLLLAGPGLAAAEPALPGTGSLSGLTIPDVLPGILDGLLPGAPDAPGGPSAGKTRCTTVIQVGDSTSENVDDAAFGANTATAQYRAVGATEVKVDALNGRAIVGGPGTDAEQAVTGLLASGARGCWVIAMGVNDAGAISTGGTGADARIDRVMSKLNGQPVLWPTIASSSPSNQAFGAASMSGFNDALRKATRRYPNLAVYDWAAAATPEMFAGDGIHYTAAGTQARNRAFAAALARAYPPGVGDTPAIRWIAG